MTGLVLRRVRSAGVVKLKLVPVVPKLISEGVIKLERVRVICPACGQQVEAVAGDGRVRGYCAVARQYVNFQIETQLERKKWWQDPEYRARVSAASKKLWEDPEYRARVSAGQKNLWEDPEHRARMSAGHTGKHPTAETKAKISEALTRWHNKKGGEGKK